MDSNEKERKLMETVDRNHIVSNRCVQYESREGERAKKKEK